MTGALAAHFSHCCRPPPALPAAVRGPQHAAHLQPAGRHRTTRACVGVERADTSRGRSAVPQHAEPAAHGVQAGAGPGGRHRWVLGEQGLREGVMVGRCSAVGGDVTVDGPRLTCRCTTPCPICCVRCAVYIPSSTKLGLGRTVTVPKGHVWLQVGARAQDGSSGLILLPAAAAAAAAPLTGPASRLCDSARPLLASCPPRLPCLSLSALPGLACRVTILATPQIRVTTAPCPTPC